MATYHSSDDHLKCRSMSSLRPHVCQGSASVIRRVVYPEDLAFRICLGQRKNENLNLQQENQGLKRSGGRVSSFAVASCGIRHGVATKQWILPRAHGRGRGGRARDHDPSAAGDVA